MVGGASVDIVATEGDGDEQRDFPIATATSNGVATEGDDDLIPYDYDDDTLVAVAAAIVVVVAWKQTTRRS